MKKILFWIIVFSSFISLTFAWDWNLPWISIISRKERWVDETIRFSKLSYAERKAWINSKSEEDMKRLEETDIDAFLDKQKQEYITEMRNDYLVSNYPSEQTVDNQVFTYNNNFLRWPQSYHYNKTKVIVHHTAGDTSAFTGKESVITYLQDIYKYHTITKWWGDIWYHFLIDPYGNIYEGRAGWEWVIAAHTSRNNSSALWISLMGNFDKQELSKEQYKALISLLTALAKKYNIDPNVRTDYFKATTEAPYMKSVENYSFAGHRDAWVTSCPGVNVYKLLPEIRKTVISNLAKWVLVSYTSTLNSLPTIKQIQSWEWLSKWLDMIKNWQPEFDKVVESLRNTYLSSHKNISLATVSSQKIQEKITPQEAKNMLEKNISVLLYELSTKFTKWNVSCAGKCIFDADGKIYTAVTWNIEIVEWWLLLTLPSHKQLVSSLKVTSKINNVVTITNYKRTSLAKIARNSFYGQLLFTKDTLKNLTTSKFEDAYVVVNTLPFKSYLKGIVETNDTEHAEKIKVMNIISKTYALFYLSEKNRHPSIPEGSTYQAIDSPDMFQKYVGAWLEKTLKKVPLLVQNMENQIAIYSGYIPILPYFSCSAGFTWSAQQKRWWTDTPYLQGRIDFEKCSDFNGHGVGLSGKWAQYLAKQWWTYKQILQYYYPGIEVINL